MGLDYDPYGFSATTPVVTTDPERLASNVFQDDDLYPSLSLTYMRPFWADTFQLRGPIRRRWCVRTFGRLPTPLILIP